MEVHVLRAVLLSGGIDSTILSYTERPQLALFINYGQRSALAEAQAAANVAEELGLEIKTLTIDCSVVGSGDMAQHAKTSQWGNAPEWWPYRNQILITFAAAALVEFSPVELLVGTVLGDELHSDGKPEFATAMNQLLAVQEGSVRVVTPLASNTTEEWIRFSGIPRSLLGWTYSCHRGSIPCGECRGCIKRQAVLQSTMT